MLTHPAIDPVLFRIGDIAVHWYGVAYLAAFLSALLLGLYRASPDRIGKTGKKEQQVQLHTRAWSRNDVHDMLFFGVIGVIVGGRMGYVLLYNGALFLSDPLSVLYVWQGGMSFHGGLIGVMTALFLYARTRQRTFLSVFDFAAPLVPLGLFFGRIANFINSELWGRPTDVPWAMIAPWGDYAPVPRHPSQLYEAGLEGLLLFTVVWLYSRKERPIGRVAGVFGIGYGLARFAVEFVRLPDAHIGYIAFGWLTMGQLLSVPMIGFGLWLYMRRVR